MSTSGRTDLENVAGTAPSPRSCLSGATREGQKTVQGGEMSQLVVKIVKVRESSGTFSIILTVSQLSGASAFCWIELPPIVCRFQWLREHTVSAQSQR